MGNHSSRPREFLYVDVQRSRSLLAQLGGGVVDQVKALKEDSLEAEAQARILGFGGKGGYGRSWGSEESRSLQDMVFAMFEDSADEKGIIRDLEDFFHKSESWADGTVHAAIREGEIIRVVGDVRILDGGLFRSRIKRIEEMAGAIVQLSGGVPAVKGPSGQRQKQQTLESAKTRLLGGVSSDYMDAISTFVENFLGDAISMRSLPCGDEHLEFSFGGSLLGRKDYIQEEREHLFSRYGSHLRDWTCVLQVATVPLSDDAVDDIGDGEWTLEGGKISRAATERGAARLLSVMEGIGLTEGPHWPTISVTPLAVYRDVPSGSV